MIFVWFKHINEVAGHSQDWPKACQSQVNWSREQMNKYINLADASQEVSKWERHNFTKKNYILFFSRQAIFVDFLGDLKKQLVKQYLGRPEEHRQKALYKYATNSI